MSFSHASGSAERRAEARRLTKLMETIPSFTYLRMGDGELALLLEVQEFGSPRRRRRSTSSPSLFQAFGVTGLNDSDYGALIGAYERCSYLDTYERFPYSGENFHNLRLCRKDGGINSPAPEVTQLFYEWIYLELPEYCRRHQCLIAGGEGDILRCLLEDPRYHEASANFWPTDRRISCVGIRDNGRNYWDHLAEIKADLAGEIARTKADTLFLSLGSGAKILGQELSEELGITCFDMGAALRGLTYSATPGYSSVRNSHNPFYFRVPLDVYLDALEKACPGLPVTSLVAKAQAQACMELARKEVMNSYASDAIEPANFDPNLENMNHFRMARKVYERRFGSLLKTAPEGRRMARAFNAWCADHGIGWPGKIVLLKRLIRKAGSRVKRLIYFCAGKRARATG